MAARDRYSDTLREIKCVQDCIDRGLLAAIEGAQPSGIGKKLTQKGFEMIQSLEDETLSKYETGHDYRKFSTDGILKSVLFGYQCLH